MKRFLSVTALTLLGLSASLQAAIDETIRVKESIEVNAPVDKVWAKIGSFGDLNWHPAIAKTAISSGENNVVGATRVLTLKDGGTIHEVLTGYDAAHHTMKYDITESVLPLRDYSATLSVQATGDKTIITWRSMFKRLDPANPPKAGQDDQTARDTITHIFKTGLETIKKASE